jgi:hypothetical protein
MSLGGRDASGQHMPASPNSPPNMRPQSHPNQYANFGGRQRTPQHRDRRSSMYSQFGQSPYANHVPLPHEDQAHFHPGGLPDLDSFGVVNTPGGLSPGERGYYCAFDTLSTAGHGPSVSAENVLLVGWEGGVRVQRVSRKNIDIIGAIEGLRGGVVGAKILPWTFRMDPGSTGRPYIALIIHGPLLGDEHSVSSNTSEAPSTEDQDHDSDPSARINNAPPMEMREIVKKYQTTVEIYSLATRKHVATVFRTPSVDIEYSAMGDFRIPPPCGDLRLEANGKYLAVSSGMSGEVFIFSPFTKDPNIQDLESIRCIGKFWTSIQRREVKPSTSTSIAGEQPSTPEETDSIRGIPLFSLSHRWMAVVPPPADSLFSVKGKATLATETSRPPGITTHVSPPKPTTNCAVDTPEDDSLVNRMVREGTQRAIKSAQWIGEHGTQLWNTYWKGGSPNAPSNGPYTFGQEIATQQVFPPTHGINQISSNSSSAPVQVAIYDLQRLLDYEEMKIKNALTPMATFEPPSGCSFLSFAPSGLTLMTVSKKGDQQFVWSLMRMQYPKSGVSSDQYPHVRQIFKFTRMTVANTVDVMWTTPQGNRYALLTDKGTVHVHEIPASAFNWPPLRRSRRKPAVRINDRGHPAQASAKGAMGVAMDAVNGTGAWIRSAVRPKSLGTASAITSNLMMTPAATANVGGKAVKAGLSKGVKLVANSANTIYHASENKLHMASLINHVTPGSMRWMTGKDRGYLAIIVTGTVNIYAVKQTSTPRKGMPPSIRAKISKKPTEFALQKIPDDQFAPAFRAIVETRFSPNHPTNDAPTQPATTGHWALRSPTPVANTSAQPLPTIRRPENWHSLVEAETNPPYQPFHTDRRVILSSFADPDPSSPPSAHDILDSQAAIDARTEWTADVLAPWLREEHHVDPAPLIETWPVDAPEAWVFGEKIPATKVLQTHGAQDGEWSDDEDAVENRIRVVEGEDGEQVLMTTIMRRGREEEEFFEDGCEVVDFADDRV